MIFCAQIILCVLKWGGVIDWSWLWVLSPLWIGAAVFLLFGLGFSLAWTVWTIVNVKIITKKRKTR